MKQASISTTLRLLISIAVVFSLALTTSMAAPFDKRALSSCYKQARITQYWIPKEGDVDMTNDGESVRLDGSRTKSLKDKNGKTIAKVSKTTYDKFQMEGTGLLESGIMVNLGSSTDEFLKLDRAKTPYGLGSSSNGLQPWVSVASNDLERGTTLYVEELDGLKLPDGKVHNGCVRVDDEGWSLDSCQIDFFVLQFSAYEKLVDEIPSKVTVTEKSCEIKDYVTSAVKKWAVLKK
ncbi:MAG: hypothetical protein EXX96DRAFT_552728 [Benjaminiella poitrasii]|nr:MAG: hypothetical protein EXX96DRAFT_552728 [Benjaminiella poitrasii]